MKRLEHLSELRHCIQRTASKIKDELKRRLSVYFSANEETRTLTPLKRIKKKKN
jgi:hypothetical protein